MRRHVRVKTICALPISRSDCSYTSGRTQSSIGCTARTKTNRIVIDWHPGPIPASKSLGNRKGRKELKLPGTAKEQRSS